MLNKLKLPEIKPYFNCQRQKVICNKCDRKRNATYRGLTNNCSLDYNIPIPYRNNALVPLDCDYITEHLIYKKG